MLDEYCAMQISDAKKIDVHYQELWRAIHKNIQAGGKRLRPYLVLLSYHAFGGNNYKQIMPIANAHELLHQALLIHDDIIDRDDMRHGQENVIGSMSKMYAKKTKMTAHYAESAAILGGDLLLSGAYQLVISSGVSTTLKIRIMKRLGGAISAVGAGEFIDMESAIHPLSEVNVLKIAELKTASYSFITPLLCGAELAHAPESVFALLTDFGKKLGIAYQLQDDILGIFGDEEVTGKSTLSDIREGKPTLLMQHALKTANPIQRKKLIQAYGNPKVTRQQVKAVKTIIIDCGALEKTEERIVSLSHQAKQSINGLLLSDSIIENFYQFVENVLNRKK